VLNVGSGYETSVRQLAGLVAETVGGGVEPEFIEEELVGYTHRVLSNELARSVLGYQPKVTLKEGLSETLAWVKREGLDRAWLDAEMQESRQPLQLFGDSGLRRAA
jgi:UDP-glucose 4-epimerase